MFYTDAGQDISVGDYWNGLTPHPLNWLLQNHIFTDPYHQELYSQYGKFLPFLNNGSNPGECKISIINKCYYDLVFFVSYMLAFKSNFLKVQRLVLIGGPDDGVITPWESRYALLSYT